MGNLVTPQSVLAQGQALVASLQTLAGQPATPPAAPVPVDLGPGVVLSVVVPASFIVPLGTSVHYLPDTQGNPQAVALNIAPTAPTKMYPNAITWPAANQPGDQLKDLQYIPQAVSGTGFDVLLVAQ